MNSDSYIDVLKEKIKYIDDKELVYLVEKLIEERDNLINVARIDLLTGVYNKSILDHIIGYSYAIMCDVDNFKLINDRYGHLKGDFVIKEVAKILSKNFRIKDYVCRFGGDEFLIVVDRCEKEVILDRLQCIKNEINNNEFLVNLGVTLSIGVACVSTDDTLNDLIDKADIALYESKNMGKNLVSVYGNNNVKKR